MTEDGRREKVLESFTDYPWMLLISGECFVGLRLPRNDIKALACPACPEPCRRE